MKALRPFALSLWIFVCHALTLTHGTELWDLARQHTLTHRFSTLFAAQDFRDRLVTPKGLQTAIDWCKTTAITKVYVESFRDGYQAEKSTLENAMQKFRAAGFEVSGCVTTTKVGQPSTGWKEVASCYTHQSTQEKLQAIFEFAAALSDEIMIDDFWFLDCTCSDCDSARLAKTIVIGEHKYPVQGDTWEDYRCELMVRLSRERILEPARRVNPRVRLIIKYPQWYDRFHERGYEVIRETAEFDRIWVGTETRNYDDPKWGGMPQYEGYFIMRWLGQLGGSKCGGGWFDPFGTTEPTYIEQARQTVLGGARESLLFCYSALQGGTGPKNIAALRPEIPELLEVARQVHTHEIIGVSAYKPPNSHPEREPRVFDFIGMMGIPLVPCHEFPTNASAAFFSIHSLKDAEFVPKLTTFIKTGRPILLTDGLAQALTNRCNLQRQNIQILPVKEYPKGLLKFDQEQVDAIRMPLLKPFHLRVRAPNQVALYLFKDGSWVVENFNNESAKVELNGTALTVAARGWTYRWCN